MNETGVITWMDLTVPNATSVRDFYAAVTGWLPVECPMGDYSDYTMHAPGNKKPVAGICHARGVNAGLPPQWLIYITVANLDQSIQRCRDFGGSILAGPKTIGTHG